MIVLCAQGDIQVISALPQVIRRYLIPERVFLPFELSVLLFFDQIHIRSKLGVLIRIPKTYRPLRGRKDGRRNSRTAMPKGYIA